MSKISNELIMLKLLMNHRKYSIKELSDKLEVSPRMVRIYKNDLEKAGFFIESILGLNGGYLLYDDTILPSLKLSRYDIELLQILVQEEKNLIRKEKINDLLNKIKYNYNYAEDLKVKFPKVPEEKELINLFSLAIKKHSKVTIWYQSLDGSVKKRIIIPFGIFALTKEDWIIAAFCELRGEVRNFNINRINKYEIIN